MTRQWQQCNKGMHSGVGLLDTTILRSMMARNIRVFIKHKQTHLKYSTTTIRFLYKKDGGGELTVELNNLFDTSEHDSNETDRHIDCICFIN